MARGGSKGIKNKNLKKIGKISLVGLAGEFAKNLNLIDTAIVSTNSTKIAKEAQNHFLNFLFLRPKKLSGSRVSDEAVLNHSLLKTEKLLNKKFDVIVSLTPTSPLRKKSEVIKSIKKLVDKKYNSVWTISETDKKYHPHKALTLSNKQLKFFSKKGKYIKYRQQLITTYFRNGNCYVFSRNAILNKDILPTKSSYIICKSPTISIDTITDLKKVKKIIQKKNY